MKILYVGGIYPVEFSLYYESLNNPNINVRFCTGGEAMPDVIPIVNPKIVQTCEDIAKVKAEFNPDLVLFRTWSGTEQMVRSDEVLWSQEIYPTLREDEKNAEYKRPPSAKIVAYQSKPMAIKKNQKWLPYCVSKHRGKQKVNKDIPIMVATSILEEVRASKIKSSDILIKPLIEWNKDLVHAFCGLGGGLEILPYIGPCLKEPFHPIDATYHISRAKIYLSPTAIWYDEGCVSYKTVEAMACGTLTITNNYIGMEDVFGKDKENLLYSNSPEETLDKVKYYLKHDSEREAIAERGYEFIHREYNWEKHLSRLIEELK